MIHRFVYLVSVEKDLVPFVCAIISNYDTYIIFIMKIKF